MQADLVATLPHEPHGLGQELLVRLLVLAVLGALYWIARSQGRPAALPHSPHRLQLPITYARAFAWTID